MRYLMLLLFPVVVCAQSATDLTDTISKVCPIDGVSIGRKSDKSTWQITFDAVATDEQKKAAQAVLDGWSDVEDRKSAAAEKIMDLLVKRKRFLLWNENDKLRAIIDRQKDIDTITSTIDELIATLEK